MSQELEGGAITPQQHFESANKSARETFGTGWRDNFSLMRMVAPRFIEVIENGTQKEETQAQRYELSRVAYTNGTLTYSLTPPLGSPLPYLEINQERGEEGFRYGSITMYKRPDFRMLEESYDRGMIDHFRDTVGDRAQYLESLTNAYSYLQKYGARLENCKFPYVGESVHTQYPQIRQLMERSKEASRLAEERRSHPAIADISEEAVLEDNAPQENGVSTFMRSVRDIVNALYPSGEIGSLGQYVLLAAEAYASPTEVDGLAQWMWGDRAEFAVASADIAGFMRTMLNQARSNPGILGVNERLFILSTPPMWEPTPDDEYITLVTRTADGRNRVGKMHINKLNLPGGGTRVAGPGAPSYMGLFPKEWVDVQLQRAIDACDFAVSSEREVAQRTIMLQETIGNQTFDRPLNLEIVGEPKREIYRDPVKEAGEAEMQRQLYEEMMQQLASPEAVTVEFYTEPGKPEPSIDREGARWERFIVLNSADGKYGIAIDLLQNDPEWQAKDSMRLKPRGERNRLRLLFLERGVNILGSITFPRDFEALIETFPDHHAGIMVQGAGEPYARPDGGRTGAWDDGRIFMQSPKVHVGTTDREQYTPPREMTEDELEWLLNMIKIDRENPPVFDQETMDKTKYWVMRGGRQVSVGDVDPFVDFLQKAKYSLLKPKE